MSNDTLPDWYMRLTLDPDDADKLEAGTHRITKIVGRKIIVEPVLCYKEFAKDSR